MKSLWSIHKSKEIKSTPLLRSAKNSPKYHKKTKRNPETILEIYFWIDVFSLNSWRCLDNLVCPFESNGTINIHFTLLLTPWVAGFMVHSGSSKTTLHLKGNSNISSPKWGHFCSNAFLSFHAPITLWLLRWLISVWALLCPQQTWFHIRNCHGNPGAVQNSRCDRPRRSSGEMCLPSFASSVDKHCLHLFGLFCPHSPAVTLSHTHKLS